MLIIEKAAVVLLLIVVSPFANAMTLRKIEIACPIGGERFKTTIALSGTQFGQNLDRRPFGAIAAPWPLAKCPNGFVIYKEKFPDSELKRLKSYVLSKDYQALKTSETNYYLAARLMRQLDVPIQALADALLKATWEAEQDSRYRRYATEALSAFEAVIASPPREFTAAQISSYQQIAGELERRLGHFEAARRRFAVLLAAPGVKGTALEAVVRQEIALVQAKDSTTHPAKTDGARRR